MTTRYQVKIGFAPGDWEFDSEHQTLQAAKTRQAEIAGKIFIGRYKFALPIKIKRVTYSVELRRQIAPAAVVSAPVLRKAS